MADGSDGWPPRCAAHPVARRAARPGSVHALGRAFPALAPRARHRRALCAGLARVQVRQRRPHLPRGCRLGLSHDDRLLPQVPRWRGHDVERTGPGSCRPHADGVRQPPRVAARGLGGRRRLSACCPRGEGGTGEGRLQGQGACEEGGRQAVEEEETLTHRQERAPARGDMKTAPMGPFPFASMVRDYLPRLNCNRRRRVTVIGSPLRVAGLYSPRLTASIAERSNTCFGCASTTVTLATVPSVPTVSSTSTQPSWFARMAAVG